MEAAMGGFGRDLRPLPHNGLLGFEKFVAIVRQGNPPLKAQGPGKSDLYLAMTATP
jgi:hypothetical protein